MSAPDIIRQLVQHFEEQRATYCSDKYKETQGPRPASRRKNGSRLWN